MLRVVEVRLREQGKNMMFNAAQVECKLQDMVIVESERGLDYGLVVSEAESSVEEKPEEPMKKVVRAAAQADLEQIKKNKAEIKNIIETADKKIDEAKLQMKLVEAEYSFDKGKIVFYFTAEGRIDFRDLVRDLAHIFKARIELKQIGVRDEVKMFGGFGCCGRNLCCVSFLKDFEPVTIRMAKQQNMPLNPEKISGLCGRLMCCLSYEYETYQEFSKTLPKEGEHINTPEGKGRVISVNTLQQRVVIEMEDERKVEICFRGMPERDKEKDKEKDGGKTK